MRTPASLVLLLFVCTPAAAQTTPPPAQATPPAAPAAAPAPFPAGAKIAFVNLQFVIAESKAGKATITQLQQTQQTLDEKLKAMAKEVQDLSAKMESQRGLISIDAFRAMEVDLDRKQRTLQFESQSRDADLQRLSRDLLDGFSDKVMPIVEQVRQERGLWAIFGARPEPGGLEVLVVDPGLDLSHEIIKRLDAGTK